MRPVYDYFVQNHLITLGSVSMQPEEITLPELVLIPAGSFDMGEQEAAFIRNLDQGALKYFGVPGKFVAIDQPFYMTKYEITNKEYASYLQPQNWRDQTDVSLANAPAVEVNWRQAMNYAKWLGEQKKLSCRLPTEAEWEYAARAGLKTAYPWGNETGVNNANCRSCGSSWDGLQAAPVGQFKANLYGLYDTSGNVWEWTCSLWRDQYEGQEQQCARMEDFGSRVVRGGSWAYDSEYIRSSTRGEFDASIRYNGFGFRVMCVFPIQ